MASQIENQLLKLFLYLFNDFPENDWTTNKLLKNTPQNLQAIKEYSNSNSNLRVLFFNRKSINDILYENDDSISLNRFKLNLESLYNLFYLDLLIMNDPDVINYKYSLDFITNLNSFIENNNKENQIQNIILLKVEFDLIENYKGMDEYKVDIEEDKLNKMEVMIKNMIPDNLNIGLNKNDIFDQKIDIIYAQIIFHYLKLKNFEEFESKIKNQLFLENIYITKDMLNKLCELIDKENKNDFIIEKIEDLSDIDKINFHYVLLKDILKKPFFIYQIPFLYNARTIIINSIKKDVNTLLSLKNHKDKKIQEKIEYIIFKLLDSEYYHQKIINLSKDNSIKRTVNSSYSTKINSDNQNSKENNKSISFYNEEEFNISLKSNKSKTKSKSYNKDYINNENESQNSSAYKKEEDDLSKKRDKSSELEVLEFIEIIKEEQSEFKKLSNNYYISGGKGELSLYDSLYHFKTKINIGKKFPLCSSFYYIYELNCDSNQIKIAIMCKSKYYVVTFNLNNFTSDYKDFSTDLAIQSIFPIPNIENKYIITGNKGIYNITSDFNFQIIASDLKEKPSFIGGINIDENTLALVSNSIIPNGEDKLILYNKITNGIILEISGHSFRISSNCLSLIENEKDGKKMKILLCACKKYTKEQKNGILLVDLSKFGESKKINELFYETGPFEVDCFCPISLVENTNSISEEITKKENIEIKKTDFFFVGGFDDDKREGIIKLYKLNYNNNKIDNIDFIQDIANNYKNNSENSSNKSKESKYYIFEGFGRSITSIIQSNIIGNILVTSMDGNVYLFKPPNIDYFLNSDYL